MHFLFQETLKIRRWILVSSFIASYKFVDHVPFSWSELYASIYFKTKCKLKVISWHGNEFASYKMLFFQKTCPMIFSTVNILPWQELIDYLIFLLSKHMVNAAQSQTKWLLRHAWYYELPFDACVNTHLILSVHRYLLAIDPQSIWVVGKLSKH